MNMNEATHFSAQCQRAVLLADVHYLYMTGKAVAQSKVNYAQLLSKLSASFQISRAIAYLTHKPDSNQDGFIQAITHSGFDVRIKEAKARVEADGKMSYKTSWKVGITIDALRYAKTCDTIILATGDGDFSELVVALKAKACRVVIAAFERSVATDLVNMAHEFIPITNQLLEEKSPAPQHVPVFEDAPDSDSLDARAAAKANALANAKR
jgi:uncharacterized LabA/DUF88 family protein